MEWDFLALRGLCKNDTVMMVKTNVDTAMFSRRDTEIRQTDFFPPITGAQFQLVNKN